MNDSRQSVSEPEWNASSCRSSRREERAVVWTLTGRRLHSPASMPSMRQSYTVTVPEEPPAAAFPFLKQEMRRKGSMSGSVLVSTFVGLLINQAKVRDPETSWSRLWLEHLSKLALYSFYWATMWNSHGVILKWTFSPYLKSQYNHVQLQLLVRWLQAVWRTRTMYNILAQVLPQELCVHLAESNQWRVCHYTEDWDTCNGQRYVFRGNYVSFTVKWVICRGKPLS